MTKKERQDDKEQTNMKLNAKQLRASEPTKSDLAKIKRRDIYIILDNVLDTYNIGSIFRLADAVGAKCVYLCGQSETPPNSRIAKASVGCDKWVPWQYASTAVEEIEKLKGKFSTSLEQYSSSETKSNREVPLRVIAIEQSKNSVDFRKADYKEPVAFVVGHETEGVSREALKAADEIVEIPMYGANRSLNVMVSLAIILYKSLESLP